MIGYIIAAFFIYFLYKIVVGFVLPIVRTTRAMRRKMQEMQSPPKPAAEQPSKPREKRPLFSKTAKEKRGDYIDFEEMKENE